MRDCLTCKYEPEWEPPLKWWDYQVKEGYCKWIIGKPIPAAARYDNVKITYFLSDEAGIHTDCPTWEPKDV